MTEEKGLELLFKAASLSDLFLFFRNTISAPAWRRHINCLHSNKDTQCVFLSHIFSPLFLLNPTRLLRLLPAPLLSLSGRTWTWRSSSWDRSCTRWRTTSATTAWALMRRAPAGQRWRPNPPDCPPDPHPDPASPSPDWRRSCLSRLTLRRWHWKSKHQQREIQFFVLTFHLKPESSLETRILLHIWIVAHSVL